MRQLGYSAYNRFLAPETALGPSAANMATEAFLGFHAFNTKKLTGQDVIDFVRYRQLLAEGHPFDDELKAAVMGKPK